MNKSEVQSFQEPIEGKLRTDLDAKLEQFAQLERDIADPEVQQDREKFQRSLKAHGSESQLIGLYKAYLKTECDLTDTRQMAAEEEDEELRELAAADLESLEQQFAESAQAVREALLDRQVQGADSNAIVEIRAGAGGDEAALFAAEVFKMYSLYAERKRWKVEVLDASTTPLGGYKEITFSVSGSGAFRTLRFESGGHRVQRVPETETQGRIHTSAVTVAVLQDVEESEIEIKDNDLRIDTFCASGPGGQKVNKTSSAVRITHLPTNIVVSIQDEKSQHKNKSKAMRVLRSRLMEAQEQERRSKEDAIRRTLIGSGDRSDRVRTYNFPQNRITDHRINVSVFSLEKFMAGEIDELVEKLHQFDREQRVQSL